MGAWPPVILMPMQAVRTVLADLIDAIRRQEAAGRGWQLAPTDLQRLLGLSREQYLQEIYTAQVAGHPLLSLSAATHSFRQASIRELVALLEHLCGAEAVPTLERAGIFFSHAEQAEIMAEFLSGAAATVRDHEFQTESFTAMLHTFGSLPHARQVYLAHYFDMQDLQRRAAARYCAARTFALPDLAVTNAEGLLRFLFAKHILKAESIFSPLHESFLAAAVSAGYAESPRERRAQREAPPSPTDAARRTMGLGAASVTRDRLKSRYKQLMKRYHPDVNPHGLRRCQEINAAYSALVAALR